MKALAAKGGKVQTMDAVPEITRKHFEEAWSGARVSVTEADLHKFEQFRRKFDPKASGGSGSGKGVKWPTGPGSGSSSGQTPMQGARMPPKGSTDDELYN
jgi:hypothetical protein